MKTIHRYYFYHRIIAQSTIAFTLLMVIFCYIPATHAASSYAAPEYSATHLTVEFEPGTISSVVQQQFVQAGVAAPVNKRLTRVGTQAFTEVTVEDTEDVAATIQQLQQQPGVTSVHPSQIRRITSTPADTRFSEQWHLMNSENGGINAQNAWDTETGSSDVIVAVIDTGVDTDHPDIANNMWQNTDEIAGNSIDDDNNGFVDDVYGYDFVDNNGDPTPTPNGLDDDGYAGADIGVSHGTHVAGIIGAVGNNNIGVSGVAWDVQLMAVQVLDDEGAGTDASIAQGIQYAVDNGADIIHMSLGGYGSTTTLQSGINYALSRGAIVVAALGNDGVNVNQNPFFPACYDDVIGITSTGQTNAASAFSNYGTECADVAAPGESILSTVFTGAPQHGFSAEYGLMSGTSMAAPTVSGMISLLLAQDSQLSRTQVTDIITLTADDVDLEEEYGSGRVNVAAAVGGMSLASSPESPTITAYADKKKKQKLKEEKRYAIQKPYFTWSEPHDADGVDGYYVYFGKSKHANPQTEGTFQRSREYRAEVKDDGNDTVYYLLVSAQDTEGHVSNTPAQFAYTMDTSVQRPQKVTLQRISAGVRVAWKAVKKDHVAEYKVLRREVVAEKNSTAKTKQKEKSKKESKKKKKKTQKRFQVISTVEHSELQYVDKQVTHAATYEYRVRSIDDLGNSHTSETERITFRKAERIVMATGSGVPNIRVYDPVSRQFTAMWQPFSTAEASGVLLGVGSDTAHGKEKIATLPKEGIPFIKVFDGTGDLYSSFTIQYSVGQRFLSVEDANEDGSDEIVVATERGMGTQVSIYTFAGDLVNSYSVDRTAVSDIDVLNVDDQPDTELVLASTQHNQVHVAIVDVFSGELQFEVPVPVEFGNRGASIAGIENVNSRTHDVLLTPKYGAVMVQRMTLESSRAVQSREPFYGFVGVYTGGGNVDAGNTDQLGKDHIIVGSNGGRQATVQIFSPTGATLEDTVFPFGDYDGPVVVEAGTVE